MSPRDYSPARRARLARALRAARDYMWNGDGASRRPEVGEHGYVCLALTAAALAGDVPKADALEAREELKARMGGFGALEDWLKYKRDLELQDDHTMQGLRFAWIEEMLKEFER